MTKTRKNILAGLSVAIVFGLLLIAGCEEAVNQAVVVSNNETDLAAVSSIPVELSDGSMTTISKIGYPFYLVAFVDAPAGNPCYLSPEVQEIARKLWLDSINVVQVTAPSNGKTFAEDVLNLCTPPKQNVVRVFDQDRRTWNLFHRPGPGTLMLVDPNGRIASVGTLSRPDSVLFDTHRMSDNWKQMWERVLSNHVY